MSWSGGTGKKVRLKGLFEYDVGENSVAIAERSPMTGWDYVAKVHRLTLGGQEFESKKSGKSMAIRNMLVTAHSCHRLI